MNLANGIDMSNPYLNQQGVLINKFNIEDKETLQQVEYDITTQKQSEILSGNAITNIEGFGFERQQAIHKYLFEDIYEWAGKTRTVPYSKEMENGLTSVFANPEQIQPRWNELEKLTRAFTESNNLNHEQKINKLTEIFVEANHLHPFPEGNGRSLQVFMQQLAKTQNIYLDYTKNNPQEWNHASAVSGIYGRLIEQDNQKFLHKYASNQEPIQKIFTNMAQPMLKQELLQETTGKLVSHGTAPYPNSPTGAKTFFAEIQNSDGKHKFWGKGVQEALIQSNARHGDIIHLTQTGNNGKQNTWKAEVVKSIAQQNLENARLSGNPETIQAIQRQIAQNHSNSRATQQTQLNTEQNTTKTVIPQKTKDKGGLER